MPSGWLKRPKQRDVTLYVYNDSLGKPHSKTLGPKSLPGKDAWKIVHEKGYHLLAGAPEPTEITFGDLCKAFLLDGHTAEDTPKSKGTCKTETRNCRLHLSDFYRRTAVSIRSKEIKDFLRSKSFGLRDKLRQTMSGIYRHGRVNELIPPDCNPVKDVGSSAKSRFRAIVLAPEQTFSILKEIDDPLIWTLVVVLACTALRVSEALGLKWGDLDFQKGKISIERGYTADGGEDKPKSLASQDTVEMHEKLATVFLEWRRETMYAKDGDWVFPSYKLKGRKPRVGSMIVQDYIRPAAEKLGLRPKNCKRFGFHNLRHSLSTWLVESGVEPIVVVRMLRWSDEKMLHTYAHLDKAARQAQGEFLGKFLVERVQERVQQNGAPDGNPA